MALRNRWSVVRLHAQENSIESGGKFLTKTDGTANVMTQVRGPSKDSTFAVSVKE
jgi:hypothetical protein